MPQKSNPVCSRGITPKRVPSGGTNLRGLARRQHRFFLCSVSRILLHRLQFEQSFMKNLPISLWTTKIPGGPPVVQIKLDYVENYWYKPLPSSRN